METQNQPCTGSRVLSASADRNLRLRGSPRGAGGKKRSTVDLLRLHVQHRIGAAGLHSLPCSVPRPGRGLFAGAGQLQVGFTHTWVPYCETGSWLSGQNATRRTLRWYRLGGPGLDPCIDANTLSVSDDGGCLDASSLPQSLPPLASVSSSPPAGKTLGSPPSVPSSPTS